MEEPPPDTSLEIANKPLNEDPPSETEKKATKKLVSFLKKENAYEPEEKLQHRYDVLKEIQELGNQFVREVYITIDGADPEKVNEVFSKIFYFGSLYLQVTNPSSDIDVLLVCPRYITRQHFFDQFYSKFTNNPKVNDLMKIDGAKVPIINMIYDGIELDISYCFIDRETIDPEINLLEDRYLAHTDLTSVMSLNGPRTNMLLVKLIPSPTLEPFQTLLRFIRIWAKARAVYGNRYGYLGGVNMALLSAFIVQRYPTASPSLLIYLFFQDLADYPWPKPIYINHPNKGIWKSWDPQNPKDQYDLMPIITPSYPTINSLKSVILSTKARLLDEFARGAKLAKKCIFEGKKWSKIIEPTDFFLKYRQYLQIEISAGTRDGFNSWSGNFDAQLRSLSQELEKVELIEYAFPYPHLFEISPEKPNDRYSGYLFIGLTYYKTEEKKAIDISNVLEEFIARVYQLKKTKPDYKMSLKLLKRKDVPVFVFKDGVRPEKVLSKKTHPKKLPSSPNEEEN